MKAKRTTKTRARRPVLSPFSQEYIMAMWHDIETIRDELRFIGNLLRQNPPATPPRRTAHVSVGKKPSITIVPYSKTAGISRARKSPPRRTGRSTCCHHCTENTSTKCTWAGWPCPSHPDTCNGKIRGDERCRPCPHFKPRGATHAQP